MRHAVRRLLAVALAIGLGTACGDQIRLPAQGVVISDTLIAYALTGSDVSYPTALNVRDLVTVRATGLFNYEVGFDINSAGQAVLYPMSLLAAPEANVRQVGLRTVSGPFEDLTSAPRDGYVYDEALTVDPGETVAIEAATPCQYPYPQVIFGKLVVDSVNIATRAIHFRAVADPSCGFRSLVPGEIPRN